MTQLLTRADIIDSLKRWGPKVKKNYLHLAKKIGEENIPLAKKTLLESTLAIEDKASDNVKDIKNKKWWPTTRRALLSRVYGEELFEKFTGIKKVRKVKLNGKLTKSKEDWPFALMSEGFIKMGKEYRLK